MPGAPVLLVSYASRVIPWVAEFLSSCHPFGGVSLVLQNMVGLGGAPPDIRRACFLSDCTLSPGLGLALAFWVVHVWVFSGSPSGSECSVLCFRHGCDVVLRDLPCSSVGGLHCTGPANARQIAWENVIACGGGQVFLVRLGRRIVGGACRSYLPQVVA